MRAGREDWIEQVEVMTLPARKRRAQRLRDRGRQLAAERRRAWQRGTKPLGDAAEEFERLAAECGDRDERASLQFCARVAATTQDHALPFVARTDAGRPTDLPVDSLRWHDSRADGRISLFGRVRECKDEQRTLHMRCRDCGWQPPKVIAIGCAVPIFCPVCRVRTAQKFRADFERKRVGLVAAAQRAGLMDRYRRRADGGRFGERLVTLTLPHWGTPTERVERLRATWARFWRLLGDELRPVLAKLDAGIRTLDPERVNDRTGEQIEYRKKETWRQRRERLAAGEHYAGLSLWDLVAYLWVLEWTPGDDGLGHPHLHAWIFSPFIDKQLIQALWARAFADVCGHGVALVGVVGSDEEPRRSTDPEVLRALWSRLCGESVAPLAGKHEQHGIAVVECVGESVDDARVGRVAVPMVDVRQAYEIERDGGTVGGELVKYLTKDWEVTSEGVRRARADVFAEVFNTIDGKRMRQTSAGLASWGVQKIAFCPCCGFENHRGHWAIVSVQWKLGEQLRRAPASGGVVVPTLPTGPPAGLESSEQRLAREYWAQRDAEWSESIELRILRARWAKVLAGGSFEGEPAPAPSRAAELSEVYQRRRRDSFQMLPTIPGETKGTFVLDVERMKDLQAERESRAGVRPKGR